MRPKLKPLSGAKCAEKCKVSSHYHFLVLDFNLAIGCPTNGLDMIYFNIGLNKVQVSCDCSVIFEFWALLFWHIVQS